MDRTRWGGIVYVCQVVDPVIKGLWALAITISCFSLVASTYGIILRVNKARRKKLAWEGPRPTNILCLLATSALAVICLSAIKLFSSEQLIGIDLAPSIFFSIQASSDFYIGAQISCHLTAVAMNSQESTYGRTHINEAVSREVWQTHLHAGVGAAINAVPILSAILSMSGHHGIDLHTVMLLTTHMGSTVILALGILRFWLRSQALLRSFAKSLEALQASYVVASGGSSIVESNKRLEESSRYRELGSKPQHVQALEDEMHKLRSVIKNFRRHSRKLVIQTSISRVLLGLFCVVPYLWNKFVYVLPMNICLLRLALTCNLGLSFIPRRPKPDRRDLSSSATLASTQRPRPVNPALQV